MRLREFKIVSNFPPSKALGASVNFPRALENSHRIPSVSNASISTKVSGKSSELKSLSLKLWVSGGRETRLVRRREAPLLVTPVDIRRVERDTPHDFYIRPRIWNFRGWKGSCVLFSEFSNSTKLETRHANRNSSSPEFVSWKSSNLFRRSRGKLLASWSPIYAKQCDASGRVNASFPSRSFKSSLALVKKKLHRFYYITLLFPLYTRRDFCHRNAFYARPSLMPMYQRFHSFVHSSLKSSSHRSIRGIRPFILNIV